jgi:hypothetical protein
VPRLIIRSTALAVVRVNDGWDAPLEKPNPRGAVSFFLMAPGGTSAAETVKNGHKIGPLHDRNAYLLGAQMGRFLPSGHFREPT